jgi:L-glyceraldehyde 3-phosphate reductase
MEHRPLGASRIDVSALSLGSWRTYERLPRETGLAVMSVARECGIDFLDDARYDDETGNAPIPTGYSEVVFGELFRASGWRRDEVVVANKLWWEFWPAQTAAEELDASLARMGLDHLDLVYSEQPPEGIGVAEVVEAVGDLVAAGKARAWGVLNWPAETLREAVRVAADADVQPPCAAQLAYSLVYRSPVEDDEMVDALEAAEASIVASAVLANGALTGKYITPATAGRLTTERERPGRQAAFAAGQRLVALAADWGTTPAALAVAFAAANRNVASVLFGATSPEQVGENVAALELLGTLTDEQLAELRGVGS